MSTYDIPTQIAVAQLLPDILAKGAKAYLPALVWTIGFDGVTGTVDSVLLDRSEQREAFDGWVKAVGATASDPKPTSDGGTFISAIRRYPAKKVVVVLRTKFEPTP